MSTDPLAELARDLGCDVASSEVVLPIGADEAVLVVGSQAFNDADRQLDRALVRPLQILTAGHTISKGRFDAVGVRGLRDVLPLHDGVHALVTTANDLVLHNLQNDAQATWPVHDLADIHTLTAFGDAVLVASTATDEVWEIGLDGNVRGRVDLAPLRHRQARPIAHDRMLGGALGGGHVETTDHFHANEAFIGIDGHRYAIVHHVEGFRPIVHATNRLVGHGSGGVVDLDRMHAYDLELVAPHSARIVDDGYAIIDSGRNRLLLTDAQWRPTGTVELPGWGRGFAVSSDRARWFIGISATRRRYLKPGQASVPNGVTAVVGRRATATRALEGLEQVWSVHLVSSTWAEMLVRSMRR